MKKKYTKHAEALLLVIVAALVFFIGTFGVFLLKKEHDCGISLYTADCYRTYNGFLEKTFSFRS